MTVIYALTDPRTGDIRYVGYSSQLSRRFCAHLQDARKGLLTHKAKWIASLLREGLRPGLEVLEESPVSAPQQEKIWIAALRSKGFNLTNDTDGGDGVTMTPTIRAKIAQAARIITTAAMADPDRRKAAMSGWNTPEANLKKREAIKKRWQDPAYKARWIAKRTGKPLSDEHKEAISRGIKRRLNGNMER